MPIFIGPGSQLSITLAASSAIVGDLVSVQILALDQYSNAATNINGKVALNVASTTLNQIVEVTIVNGVGDYTFSYTKPELVTFSLTDTFTLGLDVTTTQQLSLLPGGYQDP